ncbi:TRAP transporter substrate-binding protein [Sporosarcina sp. P7]|uniref:TRAP transporter substrate-binding protein n=1 Tax=Sporosarcina sp. P7 TaxID=2048244 RepID=UPI000C16F459|nr:TRAP transporter substrate-binding protein [Sporosarcina sp. P7]PID24070.1 C4-dicarboxylate ABC transporter substrate-binding protein [Sporosarcina sp. P7]
MNKTRQLLLFSLLTVILLAACNSEEVTQAETTDGNLNYKFKMTHITQNTHIWQGFSEILAKELDERSDGRMKLDIYPGGQLGPEADIVQQLENGSVDFALLTVPYLSSRIPELDAWNMPFLFESLQEALEAQDSESAQEMLGLLNDQGLLGMGYMPTGMHHLVLKNDPIKTTKDVKGLKLRFTGGPSVLEYWEKLGASPIAMGLSEVYSSLQTGVIDGTSIDSNALLSEKYYEIAKNYVLTGHMAFGGIFTASKMKFENMPEKDQQIITDAVHAAVEWGKVEHLKREKDNLAELENYIPVLELEDKESFLKEAGVIYNKYSKKDEMIKQFIEENSNH